jgi:type VI secretion system VasI family protein
MHRILLLGLALLLAAGLPAGAPWRMATIKDPVRGEIGQVAATEGTIKHRGTLQPALLIVECADSETALSLSTADMYFGTGRSQVQWSVDGSKLEGTAWSTCEYGDCLSLRGERAIALAKMLMEAAELRLIVDRGYGAPIDATFDVHDGKRAIAAVGQRCGWLP